MANEEVLGPRKTMFVLVIVVGCFAVLWPRILSPLILGHTRDQLKPNQFDREAGCCEVIFESEVALLELLNEVCSAIVHVDGKLSPYAAAECRKTVNETCGVDIAAFLKRDTNVGRTTKTLLDTMKSSNSSCLKEHFGVPQWSISSHTALNSWTISDTMKQERPPPMRGGPHPALRERGRAIQPGPAPAPTKTPVPMPAHVRVRSSPLEGYFGLDIKPPPIPGMRPPLGSPGGPVTVPKSSMGFVMPIYTICIIVFFVYTLSKILFKRTGSEPYEAVTPDPQFRRRVFRDDSRTSPDKLVVTAISGLVAEVQQQMEESYAQNQQRQDPQDNARPYSNGTVLHNTGPVRIVATEYKETHKEKSPEQNDDIVNEPENDATNDMNEAQDDSVDIIETNNDLDTSIENEQEENIENIEELIDVNKVDSDNDEPKKSTPELLEEALIEDASDNDLNDAVEEEKQSVKVLGMEMTTHLADGGEWRAPPPPARTPPPHSSEPVAAIFLEGDIPPQSRLLVTDFEDNAKDQPAPTNSSSLVVSGKMTLSLIQDAPRDTPERDLESTVDDFTTASALTQPAAEKDDELSEEEIEEEIEEEVEVEEVEEIEEEEAEDEPAEDKPSRT